MQAGEKTLYDARRQHLDAAQAGNLERIEQIESFSAAGAGHKPGATYGRMESEST